MRKAIVSAVLVALTMGAAGPGRDAADRGFHDGGTDCGRLRRVFQGRQPQAGDHGQQKRQRQRGHGPDRRPLRHRRHEPVHEPGGVRQGGRQQGLSGGLDHRDGRRVRGGASLQPGQSPDQCPGPRYLHGQDHQLEPGRRLQYADRGHQPRHLLRHLRDVRDPDYEEAADGGRAWSTSTPIRRPRPGSGPPPGPSATSAWDSWKASRPCRSTAWSRPSRPWPTARIR